MADLLKEVNGMAEGDVVDIFMAEGDVVDIFTFGGASKAKGRILTTYFRCPFLIDSARIPYPPDKDYDAPSA